MSATLLFLIQSAPLPASAMPLRFDLRDVARSGECEGGAATDILVCADRQTSPDRLLPLDGRYPVETLVPRAAMGVAGGTLSADAEQVELMAGQVSQRIMIRFRLPF